MSGSSISYSASTFFFFFGFLVTRRGSLDFVMCNFVEQIVSKCYDIAC
jgi:hypothetical protein